MYVCIYEVSFTDLLGLLLLVYSGLPKGLTGGVLMSLTMSYGEKGVY